MGGSFHHNEVTVGGADAHFDDGGGVAAADDAARLHGAPDRDRPAVPIQKDDIDREAHAEGVDRAAARKQERPALRRPLPERQPTPPRPPRIRNHEPHTEKSRARATLVPAPPT